MDSYIHILEAAETCTGQTPNPDISGIGVRLSFYIKNLLLGEFPQASTSTLSSVILRAFYQ